MWGFSPQEKASKEKKRLEMEVCCYVENKSWKTTLGIVLSYKKKRIKKVNYCIKPCINSVQE